MSLQEKKMDSKTQAILFRFIYSIVFVVFVSEFVKFSLVEYIAIAFVLAITSLFFVSDEKMGKVIDKSEVTTKQFGMRKFYLCATLIVGLTELLSLIVVVLVYHNSADTPVNNLTILFFFVSSFFVYSIKKFEIKPFYKFCGFCGDKK